MTKIEHVAIWVKDLERMRDFYLKYFNVRSGIKYTNPKKKYSSYFIIFPEATRLELMHRHDIQDMRRNESEFFGWAHIAISLGSKESVIAMTDKLRSDGWKIVGEPRTSGDGYFESVIMDPEGNRIELTV